MANSAKGYSNYSPSIGTMNAWMNSATANQNYLGKMIGYDSSMNRSMIDAASQAQSSANAFNSFEAEKQRAWTEYMSSTAHQREVEDLKAAGLNPVLSANAGAPVGNGAVAQSNNALTSVFGNMANSALASINNLSQTLATNSANMAQSMLSNQTSRYAAELASKTNLSINEAQMQMQKYVADLNSLTSQEVARISGEYGISKQAVANIASNYASDLAYAASIHQTDQNAYVNTMNNIRSNSTELKGINAKSQIGVLQAITGLVGSFARR